MKLRDLFDSAGNSLLPKVSINMDDVEPDDRYEIAGMLRGLMCAIEGWGSIAGFTNDLFDDDGSVIVQFSSVENATRFKNCVRYYFDDAILTGLKVKRQVRLARSAKEN
ncbi:MULTISPECIES: hypothetical protein [Burkholderia]|uniref:Uncharacterized protein n=2 Tax=Burkholderia cepacia complex TaxID=87882 RepID=A0AAP1V5E5_9BURK|nr:MULTISPECIES: hypothetical protein [Burkholderia]MBK1902183.1 hypothetical protein [Burkholderia contaminans]MBK1910466.1 hypothetical protein [Burkholderia contaminans]MBK1923925.1 hypothetical protein [Burkholderia contaminans]MBK1932137.1 hypothetical protein [Burkholderia contaminans]MBK1939386.1 hypothetical protein [Burkholderia contaminans]